MKNFSIIEANDLLPEVRELLERIRTSIKGFESYRQIFTTDEEEEDKKFVQSDAPVPIDTEIHEHPIKPGRKTRASRAVIRGLPVGRLQPSS